MTDLELFLKYLKEHLQLSRLYPYVGDLAKFIYIKEAIVVVNFQQVNIDYYTKFIEKKPNDYIKQFLRFCRKAMNLVPRQSRYSFNFCYGNQQDVRSVDMNQYRKRLVEQIGYWETDYSAMLTDDNAVCIEPKKHYQDWKNVKQFQAKLEGKIHTFNHRNSDVPIGTTYIWFRDRHGKRIHGFTVNI